MRSQYLFDLHCPVPPVRGGEGVLIPTGSSVSTNGYGTNGGPSFAQRSAVDPTSANNPPTFYCFHQNVAAMAKVWPSPPMLWPSNLVHWLALPMHQDQLTLDNKSQQSSHYYYYDAEGNDKDADVAMIVT
jgi:hypothetical protein